MMHAMDPAVALTRRTLLAGSAALVADGLARPVSARARMTAPRLALAAGLPLVSTGLQAGPGQPPIIARDAWAHGVDRPRYPPEYGTVELAFVHHTENPDGYGAAEVPAMLRSIFAFHRYTHGWNDIGYNFVIDRFGRIFEARAGGIDEPVVGAQAGGYNVYSTGIAILGTYTSERISTAALRALEHLLAWKLSLHGVPVEGHVTVRVTPSGAIYSRYPANAPVSLPRVAGHRDGDSTDCPGDALYGELASVRAGAARLAGTPARATLALQAPQTPGAQGLASGTLQLLNGAPLANAPIEIQMRSVTRRGETVSERTIAQATTGANGQWSLPVSVVADRSRSSALRALCPGGNGLPASVSAPVVLAGSVSFDAPPNPGAPQSSSEPQSPSAPGPSPATPPSPPEAAPPAT